MYFFYRFQQSWGEKSGGYFVLRFVQLNSLLLQVLLQPTVTYQSGDRLLVDQLLNGLVLIYECCMVAIRRHHGWDSQRQR